jgi:hypothetical protein
MGDVIPKRMLPDLSRIDPSIYPGLPERMPQHQQAQFLDMLCNGASQIHACQTIGIPLLLVWRERHANPEFDDFLAYVIDHARPHALEELAIQFATRGVDYETVKRTSAPIYVKGEPLLDLVGDPVTVGEETITTGHEFGSHTLLQFLLKGQQREKYGTEHSKKDITVSPGAPAAVRTNDDAQRLLLKMKNELRPVIEGTAIEVQPDDGSDLV